MSEENTSLNGYDFSSFSTDTADVVVETTFAPVFIPAKINKDGLTSGTMSSTKDFQPPVNYIFKNQEKIYIIPLHKHMVRAQYVTDGVGATRKSRCLYFEWDTTKDRLNHPQDAKCQWIISAVVIDSKGNIKTDDNGDPQLIYFRYSGMRFSLFNDYMDALKKQYKTVDPIQSNPQIEQSVIMHKRFAVEVTVVVVENKNYGTSVYAAKLNPIKVINNKLLKQILDLSKEYETKFNEQFDKTSSVVTPEQIENERIADAQLQASKQEKPKQTFKKPVKQESEIGSFDFNDSDSSGLFDVANDDDEGLDL